MLQHAHNPVNWYPWGAEAFAAAKRENKPVFLSIGYATCHWCHVMERESFENEAIARILNEKFIAIKVDREQRPDVDAIYMTAVQMIAGRGGWPMSSWLSTEGKPFYGGIYYPPAEFSRVLLEIADMWRDEPAALLQQAEQLANAVARSNELSDEVADITPGEIDQALQYLLSIHDDLQGGFSSAPKFPQESSLFLLLEEARRRSDPALLQAADFSLRQMAAGGIHDQIGGGFHRYAVDNAWLVPHFEKMLYNQAALSRNYLLAFELTADRQHLRTARRTLDYVLREMTSEKGGFYSATDADSEGREGRYFIWTPRQLQAILSPQKAQFASRVWNVSAEGNFDGANILHLSESLEELAARHDMSPDALQMQIDEISRALLGARAQREAPLRDDKIITAWNGMMITAFASAAQLLDEPLYLQAATRAADFIWSHNRQHMGRLWRVHFAGNSSIDATQTDYAFLAEAMLALYDATGEQQWLQRAIELTDAMGELFLDSAGGAYFIGPQIVGGAALPGRPRDIHDNATPSGNAAALRVLTKLWYRTGEERYREQAEALLAAFSSLLSQYPAAFGYLLTAASELLSGETGSLRCLARGKVRAEARSLGTDSLEVRLSIAPGWHINANKPLQDYLVGTRLSAATQDKQTSALEALRFPPADVQTLGFQRAELALYQGDITLSAKLPKGSDQSSVVPLLLELQACNDQVCLPPETATLHLSIAPVR